MPFPTMQSGPTLCKSSLSFHAYSICPKPFCLLEQPGTLTARSEAEVGIKTSVNKCAAQKEK